MISVLSHRQRLNGSRYLFTFLVIGLIFSCTPSRKVQKTPSDAPPVTEDKIRVYDPKTDTYILIPRDAVKVDTVRWKEDPAPPVVTDEDVKPLPPVKKSKYDISLLMPFNVEQSALFSDQQDPKLNRFIQYYAGVQMAMHDIDLLNLPITIRSYDVDDPSNSIVELLNNPEVMKSDVIIGPYDKEEIEITASFGLSHEIMVVSPWLPAFSNTRENPYLIQMYAGLSSHASAIMDYIKEELPGKKVYVVSRDNPAEVNRVQIFTGIDGIKSHELIITDDSPDLVYTDLNGLMEEDRGTIFILPYFAKSDESFVNSFMRKLHADKGTKEAIVFGLPQWIGYSNLNANYMESLSLHLSISSFIDASHPEYTSFRKRFIEFFYTHPDQQAYQGYDLVMWIAKNLSQNGMGGLIDHSDAIQDGLASGFDIQPVFKSDSLSTDKTKIPMYYENKRIRILRYVDQDFLLVK